MSGRGGKYVRKAPSLTKKQLFLLLLNVVLALLALACAWGLNAVKSALLTQSAAKAWRGSSEMRFAQVSVFLPEDEKTAWVDGMKLVSKQLYETLYKAGLEEIQAEGQFDPELHDAVMQEENEDKESGEIIDVFQKGYKVKNRIIRHSMVKVAK